MVAELFEQAAMHPDQARKLITAARKLAAKSRMKIPLEWRRRFCKKCNSMLVPGKNCRVRTRKGLVVATCLDCMNIRRVKR
ncbi:Ribonuclease P protein component 4 [uncultured archaeon]|nr:Ribonuclease P protein component 4 [uncultured archaeon]